jgi:hypothetical protein
MTNYRRVALWGGLAYLATFVFSMPAVRSSARSPTTPTTFSARDRTPESSSAD